MAHTTQEAQPDPDAKVEAATGNAASEIFRLMFRPGTKPATEYEYLTIYALHDVGWVHTAEFRSSINSTEADYLPGRSIFNSVSFHCRAYTLLDSGAGVGAAKESKQASLYHHLN